MKVSELIEILNRCESDAELDVWMDNAMSSVSAEIKDIISDSEGVHILT